LPSSPEDICVDSSSYWIEVRLTRPPVNAFTVEMFDALTAVFSSIAEDPRPVLLCGESAVFSAGFDIRAPVSDPVAADTAARSCVAAVRAHPGPTVAAVEGAAVGVGLLLAASVDLLVVARNARLRMPEITLGIDADVGPLRRFVPEPWVRRMCLLGEVFTAEDLCLQAAGAVVCDPGRAHERGTELVRSLGGLSPTALREMKRQFTQ
jgi:enoyl-CoA hydratase